MENIVKEKKIKDYPRPISITEYKEIFEQLKNNCIGIIYNNDKEMGNAFFIKIPLFKGKILPFLITCNHIINRKFLNESKNITITLGNNKVIKLDLHNRITYTSEKYDITIIEIKEKDDINYFLELDDNYNYLLLQTIYILQYYELKNKSISVGIIKNIDNKHNFIFSHLCATTDGSSGSPIFNLDTNKVIGIHIGRSDFNFNKGVFLKDTLKDFIESISFKAYNNNIKEGKDDDEKTNLMPILDKQNFWNNRTLNAHKNLECIFNVKIRENMSEKFSKEKLNLTKFNVMNPLYYEDFKNLEELYLSGNNISNINNLKNIKLDNLKILDFSNNKISNINIFQEINLPKLKKLYFSCNKLMNIDELFHLKLEKLELLNLTNNMISDIYIFRKNKTYQLKELYFSSNKISNINFLEDINLNELEVLDLENNLISDVEPLAKIKMKKLKLLCFCKNEISNINILKKVDLNRLELLSFAYNNISNFPSFKELKLKKLKELYLGNNKISNLKFLENVTHDNLEQFFISGNFINNIISLESFNCKTLKGLFIMDNQIKSIDSLEKVKFTQIEIINLTDNRISDISVLKKVNFPNLKELLLGQNEISNINALENIDFKNIEKLNLRYNKIDKEKESKLIDNLKSKYKRKESINNYSIRLLI